MPEPAKKTAASDPKPAPVLGLAAESTDPAVQDLLAQRSIHERNGDDEAVQAVDAKLADLGVN